MENPHVELVRRLALALPGVEEYVSYNSTPAFRVRGKMICRVREDGETLALKLDFETCDFLMQASPDVYFTTDHYRGYPIVLARLAVVDPEELRQQLAVSWRLFAPKKLVAAYERR